MGFHAIENVVGKTYLPLKNRVGVFDAFSFSLTRSASSETQCSRRENEPTPTTTASGMRYYGFRFYSPQLGRWLGRDPLSDQKMRVLSEAPADVRVVTDVQLDVASSDLTAYLFNLNDALSGVDYLGLDSCSVLSRQLLNSWHEEGQWSPWSNVFCWHPIDLIGGDVDCKTCLQGKSKPIYIVEAWLVTYLCEKEVPCPDPCPPPGYKCYERYTKTGTDQTRRLGHHLYEWRVRTVCGFLPPAQQD